MSEAAVRYDEELDDLQGMAILDDASAEMMLQQLRQAEEQYNRMTDWYDHQKAKAKEVYELTREVIERNLRGYFDMVPTHNTKTKRSYDLPSGTITLTKQDPEYEVKDDVMVPWLEKIGRADLVRVKKEAEWGKLKKETKFTVMEDGKLVDEKTGEIIPGVTATARKDKFSIKIK